MFISASPLAAAVVVMVALSTGTSFPVSPPSSLLSPPLSSSSATHPPSGTHHGTDEEYEYYYPYDYAYGAAREDREMRLGNLSEWQWKTVANYSLDGQLCMMDAWKEPTPHNKL